MVIDTSAFLAILQDEPEPHFVHEGDHGGGCAPDIGSHLPGSLDCP